MSQFTRDRISQTNSGERNERTSLSRRSLEAAGHESIFVYCTSNYNQKGDGVWNGWAQCPTSVTAKMRYLTLPADRWIGDEPNRNDRLEPTDRRSRASAIDHRHRSSKAVFIQILIYNWSISTESQVSQLVPSRLLLSIWELKEAGAVSTSFLDD